MLADSPCRATAYASKTFSVGIATRVPQMMWTKLTKAVFYQWCYISWIQYFRTRQHVYIFFFSLTSFLAALPLFTWHLSSSDSPLKRRNNWQTKSFPMQHHWQWDPTHYGHLISTVYKGHRHILSFCAACLAHAASTCDTGFFLNWWCLLSKREKYLTKREQMLALDLFSIWILSVSDLARQVWGWRGKSTADGFMRRAWWQMVPTDIYWHVPIPPGVVFPF